MYSFFILHFCFCYCNYRHKVGKLNSLSTCLLFGDSDIYKTTWKIVSRFAIQSESFDVVCICKPMWLACLFLAFLVSISSATAMKVILKSKFGSLLIISKCYFAWAQMAESSIATTALGELNNHVLSPQFRSFLPTLLLLPSPSFSCLLLRQTHSLTRPSRLQDTQSLRISILSLPFAREKEITTEYG